MPRIPRLPPSSAPPSVLETSSQLPRVSLLERIPAMSPPLSKCVRMMENVRWISSVSPSASAVVDILETTAKLRRNPASPSRVSMAESALTWATPDTNASAPPGFSASTVAKLSTHVLEAVPNATTTAHASTELPTSTVCAGTHGEGELAMIRVLRAYPTHANTEANAPPPMTTSVTPANV